MQMSRFLVAFTLIWATFVVKQPAFTAEQVFRFDMGTADSPVAEGFQRVTDATGYSPRSGYGWVGDGTKREAFHRTAISEAVIWKHDPGAELVDGVAGSDDLTFQVDVPNGTYIVEIELGDLGGFIPAGMGRFLDTGVKGQASGGPGGPLFAMAVDAGDRRVATDVAARTYPHRGSVGVPALWEAVGIRNFPVAVQDSPVIVRLGNHAAVRFEEQVTDGHIVLRFHGDESTYRKEVERLRQITDERVKRQSMYAAGGPFTKNSVLSVVVRPGIPQPFILKDGTLEVAVGGADSLKEFVGAFNAEDFPAASRAIRSMPSKTFADQHIRILAEMWLAGHPNHWRERELLPRILADMDAVRSQDALSDADRAALDSLRNTVVDMQRGVMNFDQRTKEGQEVVPSMNRAEGYFARALPGEPFYWKSRLYQARIWYSMDPNRNAQLWRNSEQIMRDLATAYPTNRWTRYYLNDDPSGWTLTDYRDNTKDAPAWASEVHNFYNRMLDLCEWWIAHRQNDDNGALGGEWGDDVEFMPLIAYTSVICPDASPLLVEGTMRFADGAWKQSGIIDEHSGFFHLTTDAEHAAEFTGNVLGMMLHAQPGDPEYVERSMKTGKLMRDIWMGRNERGHRLVRSSFLGAFHVPNTETDIDTAICGRAMNPAWHVLEFNRSPEIARLVVEYADTLVELALSTQKGKPRGVLPGPVVFETGELGSPGSEKWWLAPSGSFQGMFSFPDYHGFRTQILTIAWRLTGDESYLEPIRLEAALIEEHYPKSQREEDQRQQAALAKARPEVRTEARRREDEYRFGPEAGTVAWTARLLSPMGVLEHWDDLQWEMKGTDPQSKGVLLNKDEVAREAHKVSDVARHRWPIMTDDATMTDRVGFAGCANATVWYSGGRFVAQQLLPAFTWEGAGRDFAALALRHNSRYAKLLYYGFQEDTRDVTLRFWDLERRGTYQLTGGPDANGDDLPDEVTIEEQFVLNEPSGGVTMSLPPGRTFVLEITQTARGQSEVSVPDPAIAARDIRFDPRGHLLVDVHNIGNLAAENVEVKFYEGDPDMGGKLIGRTIVSYVEAPNTLQPQIVRTGIEWTPTAESVPITVVLDEADRIDELFERNNRATTVVEQHAPK